MTDNALIASIQSGNEQSLAEVYNRYRKEFIGWAQKSYRCTGEEAKEAYQLAIMIFYDNIMTGKLDHISGSIKTYLFAIGRNKIFESFRRNARNSLNIKTEILYMDEEDREHKEMIEEQFKKVEEGLVQLGEPCKSILEMTYYEKRSMEYITEKLGYKNTDTTKNQKYKCMQRLKKLVVKELH